MDQHQSIDWQLCLKLSNNKPALARDILILFMDGLPQFHADIAKAYQQRNLSELTGLIHKLHGACCYCGVPKLKSIVLALERQLKSAEPEPYDELIHRLFTEIDHIIVDFNHRPSLTEKKS